MLKPLVYWSILLLVCAYALWRGNRDAKIVAAVCLLASLATVAVQTPIPTRFSLVDSSLVVVDELAFAGFVVAALISDRFWPLWVAGLQLTSVTSHLLRMLDTDILPRAYAAAERFWVYPIFLLIVVGTWRQQQRREGRLPG